MLRLFIRLDEITFKALIELARLDYRDIKAEAGILIRKELVRRGMLKEDTRYKPKKGGKGNI